MKLLFWGSWNDDRNFALRCKFKEKNFALRCKFKEKNFALIDKFVSLQLNL